MFGPRASKVLRELWMNRGRSLLVILSIAIGVATIGSVMGTQQTLARELPASYTQINPDSINLLVDPFDADYVDQLRDLPGVSAADSRYVLNARLQAGAEEWQSMRLTVYSDYENIQVNKIRSISGDWPPPERQLLVERASAALANLKVGDLVTLQTPAGLKRSLRVAGFVHDLNEPAGIFTGQVSGFIDANTLEWLGYPNEFNEILISTSTGDVESIRGIARTVRGEVERGGRKVHWTTTQDPEQHWFQPFLTPMSSVLGALGGLALLLSGFLVINTISALLAQQIRQIGMMKAVGGSRGKITGIYVTMIFIYGLAALAIAIPLGKLGAQLSLQVVASLINFDTPVYRLSTQVIVLQALLSLLIPWLTAFFPIRTGTTIPVVKALNFTGGGEGTSFGASLVDRALTRINWLPRPLMLSLRNTFRRKSRLFFTLITLTLGSAIFISVQNVQTSLTRTLDETLQYYNFDMVVFFDRPYRIEQLMGRAEEIPAIQSVETWGIANAHRVRPDESESEGIMFAGPPAGSTMIRPVMVDGRWLDPQDQSAVVINTDFARLDPDLKVGSELVLKVEGRESRWTVVGICQSVLMGPWAYTNQAQFAYTLNKTGQASAVYLTLTPENEGQEAAAARQIERYFQQSGLRVSDVSTVAELRESTILQFQVIINFLLVMALLIALIGGFGLMGTMSLNVIERSREIGIMRAIGARNSAIQDIVVTEGCLIGVFSWLAGTLLAVPIGRLLGDMVGQGLLQSALKETFSFSGALIWLVIVLIISILSSMIPANQSTSTPIRQVLAYE